jgi:ABC-type transporter MlaC component
MRRTARQVLLGSFFAALLVAPAVSSKAQNLVSPLSSPAANSAMLAPTITMPEEPALPDLSLAPPGKKTSARLAIPPVKKVATAPNKPAAKLAAAPKKPTTKIAAAPKKPEAPKIAAAPPPRNAPIASAPAAPPVALVSAPASERKPGPSLAAISTTSLAPPAGVAAPPPQGVPATPAAGFVAKFLDTAFNVARDTKLNPLQRRAALAELFAAKMDVDRIAGYTAGDELTDKPRDFQRRFRTILISYLVETYYPRIELAADPSVKVEATAVQPLPDGTAVVWTTFNKSDWVTTSVKWHLAPDGDGYKIVDILSDGASLVQMERDTFRSVMRDGGLPELMAKLDARTKALAGAATP